MSKLAIKNACPFCGFLNTQILGPGMSTHGKGYQIECINCGARGPCGMADKQSAVKVWEIGDLDYVRPQVSGR